MAEPGLTSIRAQLLLCASVCVLLSCGVGNVLLAVTESVLWPLILGVGWTVTAAVVTGLAQAATPPPPRQPHVAQVRAGARTSVRPS